MVTHLSIVKAHGCLTLVIFLDCWLMSVLCSNWGIQLGDPIIPLWKKLKFTAHPSLKWVTFAQYQYKPKVKVVRVNGYINKVKQPWAFTVLRWVIIWRLLFFSSILIFIK